MEVGLPAGVTTGVGSLPHRDARAAADFVLSALPELPAIPSLPNRSPAEGMLAQAAVGIRGVAIASDGDLLVDPRRSTPSSPSPPTSTTMPSAGCGPSSTPPPVARVP